MFDEKDEVRSALFKMRNLLKLHSQEGSIFVQQAPA
jgi:hypothetical protein